MFLDPSYTHSYMLPDAGLGPSDYYTSQYEEESPLVDPTNLSLRARRTQDSDNDYYSVPSATPSSSQPVSSSSSVPFHSRFHSSQSAFEFQYSVRLSLLLLPATFALLLNGGSLLLWINLFSLLLSYGFDAIGLSEAGFACYWSGIMGSVVCSVLFHGLEDAAESGLSILSILFLFSLIFFFTGLFYTLHSPFFTFEAPEFARTLEKFIFASLPMPLAIFYSILATHYLLLFDFDGFHHFPFVFCVLYFLALRFLCLPMPESQEIVERRKLAQKGEDKKAASDGGESSRVILYPVVGSTVLAVHSVAFFLLPQWLFLVQFWPGGLSMDRICDGFALLGLQLLGAFLLSGDNYFWFTDSSAQIARGISRVALPIDQEEAPSVPAPIAERLVFLGFSLAILLGFFEYRVIIRSFSNYLHFVTDNRPFFGYSLLTAGLYCGLIATLLLINNLIRSQRRQQGEHSSFTTVLFYVFSVVSLLCLALSLGVPLIFLPALFLVAYSIHSFFAQRKFSLITYLLFFICCLILVAWFFWRQLWFLRLDFASPFERLTPAENTILGMIVLALNFHVTLRSLILLIFAFVGLTIAVPGILLISNRHRAGSGEASSAIKLLNGTILASQASLLIVLEYLISSYNHIYESAIYPPVFLLFTSCLGAYALHRLYHRFRLIHMFTYWLLLTMFVGKIGILFADNLVDLLHCFLLAFALIPVLALYDTRYFTSEATESRSPVFMKPGFAAFHAVTLFVVFFLTKNTILAHVMALLGIRNPNESTFFSAFLLSSLLFLFPILFFHLNSRTESSNIWNRRLNEVKKRYSVILILALLFVAIEPRLDFLLSSETDIPVFQAAVRMDSLHDHHQYYSWLLYSGLALFILSFTRVIPAVPPILFVVGFSSCIGLYLCEYSVNTFMVHPGSGVRETNPLLNLTLVLLINVASIQQFSLLFPSTSIPRWLPLPFSSISHFLFGAFLSLLPILLILHSITYAWYFPEYTLSTTTFASDVSFNFRQILSTILLVHAFFCFLLALSTRIRLESAAEKTLKYRTQQRLANRGAESDGMSRTFTEGELKTIGNIAAVLCWAQLVIIAVHFLEFSILYTVALAPILVLFSRDSMPILPNPSLAQRAAEIERYSPLAIGVLCCLLYRAASELIDHSEPDMSFLVKNLSAVALLAPGLQRLIGFLWFSSMSLSTFTTLLLLPLYLLAMLLTEAAAIRWIATIGIFGNLWQLYESQTARKAIQRIL